MSSDETSSKRTRASGEVLDLLLLEFERNQNPSPEQRKDISDKTGMAEKAVRIWFQNRRAKLRKFERLNSEHKERNTYNNSSIHSSRSNSLSLVSPTTSNNYLSQPSNIPIEVNEKYCFIDCSSLSVGLWQRIKLGYHDELALKNNLVNLSPFTLNSTMNNVDLLVILSKRNSEINYFFSAISNNSKILFRIFYPISSIVTCSLLDNNINKENNELRLSLSHRPKFSVYFFNGINLTSNQWSICDDFSEGQQVSQAYFSEGGTSIPHVLVGVKNSLQYLNSFIMENNQIHPVQQQAEPLQHALHSNPSYPNPTPPDSATSTTTSQITKYNPNSQIQFSDDTHGSGNFQFITDDLSSMWDDASGAQAAMTPNRSQNHTPVTSNSYSNSVTASASANPPKNQLSGLVGFSPLTNFDANSPSDYSKHSENNDNIFANSINMAQRTLIKNNNQSDLNELFNGHADPYTFNGSNTPDFFMDHVKSSRSSEHSNGSPLVNVRNGAQGTHAYTHQSNPNQYAVINSSQLAPTNAFELLDTFGQAEFDFAEAEVASNTGDVSNHHTPVEGSGGSNSGPNTNVDSFIDFGSNYP